MNAMIRTILLATALGLLAPTALAGDPDAHAVQGAVVEGDAVTGVGLVTSIANLAVNNTGSWTVEVDTDNADTDIDGALLRPFGLLVQEGASAPGIAGATIDSFDAVTLADTGKTAYNMFLDGTTGSSDDSAVYLGGNLLIQESDISTAAAFSAGTPYIGFFEVKVDDAGDVLVMASVDDPAIASTVDRALVMLDTDGTSLLSETVLAKEGDILPGQTEAVADFETGPHNFDLNDAGQVLFIADLEGDTTVDHALYRDNTLLAQEGSPSPVAGRNWSSLSSAECSLANDGSWIVSGSLDGDSASNLLIALNGAKFMQEGDSPACIAPFALTSFGSGPVCLADNGTVLWYGDWNDPDTDVDTGLFLNDQLVVQEGVTVIDGSVVDTLRGIQDGYALSDDGSWMIFEAILEDGREGAFLIEVGPWTSLGQGLAGTGGVTPSLTGLGSLVPRTTSSVRLSSAAPNALTFLVLGFSEVDLPLMGGTLVPAPDEIFIVGTDAGGVFAGDFFLPDGVPLGLDLYLQAWVQDAGAPFGYAASNGVHGVVTAEGL
jgi:hypothetical protein